MAHEQLFSPLKLGHLQLSHRVVLAPLTRFRADDRHVPLEMMAEYYAQRASTPRTLLIAEATFISPRASGQANAPGIYNAEQIAAWRQVTDAVHAKGCFIVLQLWALGRRANPDLLTHAEGGPYPLVGPSPISALPGGSVPRELSRDEIRGFVGDYEAAARNAVLAGFDGVEVHAANGYLVDQFCQAASNVRTDEYGGNVANRSRFALEVTQALIRGVGGDSKKVAVRLSPWSEFAAADRGEVVEQFGYLIAELKKFDLGYLHLVESRVGGVDARDAIYHNFTGRNDTFVELWGQAPLILAGGFTPETATKVVGEPLQGQEGLRRVWTVLHQHAGLVVSVTQRVAIEPV
jgi:NADPH2 dehydrogenase